jgi:hypothetical protein
MFSPRWPGSSVFFTPAAVCPIVCFTMGATLRLAVDFHEWTVRACC